MSLPDPSVLTQQIDQLVNGYQANVAAAVALLQSQIDLLGTQHTADLATIAGLRAQLAQVPVPNVWAINEFAVPAPGATLPTVGMLFGNQYRQAGSQLSKVAMTPGIKSRRQDPASGTNQLYIMRSGEGTSAKHATGMNVGGFSVDAADWTAADGTPLFYGNMMIAYQDDGVLFDVIFNGGRGYSSSPPGETFIDSLFRCLRMTLNNIKIDGQGKSGTNLGINNSDYTVLNNLVSINSGAGSGLAAWQSVAYVMYGGSLAFNHRPLNNEKMRGLIELNGVDFSGTRKWPHITINSGGAPGDPYVGSATLVVRAPKLAATEWPLRIGIASAGYTLAGKTYSQAQKVSDVHVFDDTGKDITNDKTKVLVGNVWGTPALGLAAPRPFVSQRHLHDLYDQVVA